MSLRVQVEPLYEQGYFVFNLTGILLLHVVYHMCDARYHHEKKNLPIFLLNDHEGFGRTPRRHVAILSNTR